MAEPSNTSSAFSQFLRGLNKQQSRSGSAAADDARAAILNVLAGGPRTFGHLSKLTGIPLTALMEEIRPLEEYRLLRRVEEDGELVLEITRGGRELVQGNG